MFCLLLFFQLQAQNRSYLRLPVKLLGFLDVPIVKIEIGRHQYSMLVDLGTNETLSLQNRYIKKIKHRKKLEKSKFTNIKGLVYEPQNYRIPNIKIGIIKFKNIILSETLTKDSFAFIRSEKLRNRVIEKERQCIDGVIGLPLFTNFDCLFDFPHSQIIIAKTMNGLIQEAKCNIEQFVRVPFDLNKKGIILSVQTDIGEKKLLLDTGATQSVLRTSVVEKELTKEDEPGKWVFESKSLVFNETDFGNCEFLLFEFSDFFKEFDGVLGLEFFKKHAICLDFHNRVAYIQP